MIYYISGFIFILGGIFRSVFYEKAFMILIGFVLYILGEIKDISEELKRISAYVSDTKILQELLKNDKK